MNASTVVTVPADASLQQVVDALETRHVASVTVVDAGDRPIGVIRAGDLTGIIEPDDAPARIGFTGGLRRRHARLARATARGLMSPVTAEGGAR